MSVQGQINLATGSRTGVVFTLPSDCVPSTDIPLNHFVSSTGFVSGYINNAGQVYISTTVTSGTCYVSATYIKSPTTITNLVQNPRAVSTGASMLYTNIAWSSTTKQWLTGQTGWANNTSTALAYTSAAANASSGNLISFITQDSASLTGYATGATVPVTIQGSRSQGGSLQLCMSWLDSNGLEISEDMPSAVTVAAGEKRTLTHNATKPSGAVRFDLQMRAPSAKAGEQVAATNFCVGSSTYFDGSTPDTASMTYAWTGTADASTSTRTETSGTLPTQPELFFDSNFAVNGVMGIYPDPNPDNLIAGGMTVYAEGTAPAALDTWLTYDPKNPSRVVCCCDSRNYKDTGNGYPRSGLTTGQTLIPGQEYWEAFSWLSTNKLGWDDWNALITAAFGPPWDGPSPTSLADQPSNTPGKNWLRFSRTPAEGGITWSGEELTIGEWVQCIIHLRLDKSPNGWIEMWLNTGPGPNSFRKVLPLQAVGTITPGNTGNCYSSIGAYGVYPHKIYIGHHQVATAAQGKQALYFEDYGLGFDPALLP